jgi:hypothetical protein
MSHPTRKPIGIRTALNVKFCFKLAPSNYYVSQSKQSERKQKDSTAATRWLSLFISGTKEAICALLFLSLRAEKVKQYELQLLQAQQANVIHLA